MLIFDFRRNMALTVMMVVSLSLAYSKLHKENTHNSKVEVTAILDDVNTTLAEN